VFGETKFLLMLEGEVIGVSWRQLWRGDAFELRIVGLGGRERGSLTEVIAGVMVRVEGIL
jgi:hypothetical protein